MRISDVRIKLLPHAGSVDRLRAFCSITLDDAFVVHDLKIIDGAQGIFVAMPSRRVQERCLKCSTKNHASSNFCNQCGTRLEVARSNRRAQSFVDIAHPIHSDFRHEMHRRVIEAYERALSDEPGGDADATHWPQSASGPSPEERSERVAWKKNPDSPREHS